MPAAVVTLRDVELVRAGTWEASTGRATITAADLDDVVAASKDGEVDHAPVKIGHVGAWAKLGDSAPALGWVGNVRRVGDRVIGDLTDVPVRLADVMGKAFRRRSVELNRGAGGLGVTTPSGRKYRMTLAGLALLGVQPPAVKGLADVAALYDAPERPIAAADGDPADGTIALDVVEGVTDDALVALLAGAATDLAAAVTVGDATQDVANAILDRIFATAGVPDATIHRDTATGGDTSQQHSPAPAGGKPPMDDKRLRELLGIEADADVEKTLTDLRTKAEATPDPDPKPGEEAPADPKPGEEAPPAPAGVAPEVAQRIAAAGAKVNPDGTIALSAGSFAALLDGVEAGLGVAGTIEQERREAALDGAVCSGRIAPTERQHFADSYKDRPLAELTTFLGGLAPRFSTVELGDARGDTSPDAEKAWDAFAADLFGDELTTIDAGGK